jgi:HEPN domain-containing protein
MRLRLRNVSGVDSSYAARIRGVDGGDHGSSSGPMARVHFGRSIPCSSASWTARPLDMTSIEDLVDKVLIEPVEADPTAAAQWLEDAGRHLEAAKKIADLDPSGAYVLAYDAVRKSVAAALLMTGHRDRSRPGSHQALAQHANSLATQTGEEALNRFDRLRRNRNRSEYGSKTFGQAEVSEAIETAGAIRAACAKLL